MKPPTRPSSADLDAAIKSWWGERGFDEIARSYGISESAVYQRARKVSKYIWHLHDQGLTSTAPKKVEPRYTLDDRLARRCTDREYQKARNEANDRHRAAVLAWLSTEARKLAADPETKQTKPCPTCGRHI